MGTQLSHQHAVGVLTFGECCGNDRLIFRVVSITLRRLYLCLFKLDAMLSPSKRKGRILLTSLKVEDGTSRHKVLTSCDSS